MADFYSVLMSSLRKRDIADPAARERVYLRARMALIRKLWGQQPRMSDREIEDEVAVFDLAVAFVESDVATSPPAPRRQRLRREKAARLSDIRFDLTEGEVEAEADPEEEDQLAYRTHLQEAATRVNQWTEAMVQRIDPITVARAALSRGKPRQSFGRVAVAGPAQDAALAEPVINMALERRTPEPGRRRFRSFFPQRSTRPIAKISAGGEDEPGRLQAFTRRVIDFFEEFSQRLYHGSVTAHRRRRGSLTPRVYIHPPMRAGAAERQQQRRRRHLLARLATPFAVVGILGIFAWVGTRYQTEITAKVEELTSVANEIAAPPPAAPGETKNDDADAAETMPQPEIVLFDGSDPSAFRASAGKPVVFGSDASGGYVRIQAPEAGEDGARLVISAGVADRLARRTVHFVVTARSPVEGGAGTVRLGYQAGDEASPFSAQPLGREYRRLEITWAVPGGSGLGEHALFIEPGLLGRGSSVDVKTVEIFFERQP